jgi:hypothetical protein
MHRRHAVALVAVGWAGVCASAIGPASAASVPVVAVGDIACDPAHPSFNGGAGTSQDCGQRATSDLALALQPRAVLLLGDLQYEDGALSRYLASFDPTWGRLEPILHPAPGNHEYGTPGAAGYFDYFGAAAGERGKGYYSFELAGWHQVALNSNCQAVGGCGPGSPQLGWLAADLASTQAACTLAFWHHPLFSSGAHGSDATYRFFWETLQEAAADLVLVGHDHDYERFAPQNAAGVEDREGGIRELVVGTGGRLLRGFASPQPNSEQRLAGAFGVLALSLYPNGYLWRFVTTGGITADRGGALCHRARPGPLADFHPLPFCRAVSTRRTDGPALREPRSFPLAGACGVPADAVAVAARLTALQSTSRGSLAAYAAGDVPPAQPALGFLRGKTVSTDLLLPLGQGGEVTLAPDLLLGGASVHALLDVSGYFR